MSSRDGKAEIQPSGPLPRSDLSRRDVLRLMGAAGAGAVGFSVLGGAAPALASQPTKSWSAIRSAATRYPPVSFWDMEWGLTAYEKTGAALAAQFNASHPNGPKVSYTPISWTNWYEKFATAISSGTAPDVSSGAAYQPFQFWPSGAIEPADSVIAAMRKSGELADFYPSTIEWMKYDGHYVALPFEIDLRVFYYRKSLLEKAGVPVPQRWEDILSAGRALAKKGIYGFAFAGTTDNSYGWQIVMSMILSNGGGLFARDGTLDCVTDANIQTVEFLQQLVREKIIDPAAPGYTSDEVNRLFGEGKVAMAWSNSNWPPIALPPSVIPDTEMLEKPLVSLSGKTGTIHWVNPVMMYKQHPTAVPADALWLEWYLEHISSYWSRNYLDALPVTKSVANSPGVKSNKYISVASANWLPVGLTTAHFYPGIVPALNTVEGAPPLFNFTEAIVTSPRSTAKQLLTTLQSGLASVIKSDNLVASPLNK